MSRVVLLAIAIVVLVWLLRRALGARRPRPGEGAGKAAPVPELVACAQCGVHLPRSEALAVDDEGASAGRYFCTEEHARLGPR